MAMAMAKKQHQPEKGAMSGLERLSLRVSSMINHPVAQIQRWVTIHRLDTDGEREWEEVIGLIAEADELELILNDDGSVTVRWEQQEQEQDAAAKNFAEFDLEETAPF